MSEQNQTPELDVQEFNNEMTQRRSKLAALREQGNPFPNDFRRDHISSEIHEQFGDKSADELAALNAKVKIAGRIMTRRIIGKASFATLQDMGGKIQVYVTRDDLPEGFYNEQFKKWDLGDIVGVEGTVFRTNAGGAYEGNRLLPDAGIERRLSAYVPVAALHRLREELQRRLSVSLGTEYTGYLGVDMMVCRSDKENGYRVHPCVEINMRMNMGVVARLFYDRFVAPGSKGCFAVEYVPDNETLRARHEQDMHDYPLTVEQGRLASGYLPLVPVTGKSCYRAYVRI